MKVGEKTTHRRATLEIAIDILRAAEEPIKKTPLFFAANLSYRSLQEHLKILIEKGLLEKVPFVWDYGTMKGLRKDKRTSHLYQTTEKGKEVVRLLDRVYKLLSWDGERYP